MATRIGPSTGQVVEAYLGASKRIRRPRISAEGAFEPKGPQGHYRKPWQWLLSAYLSCLVTTCVVLAYPNAVHWGLMPITISGFLIGVDASQVLRGRDNIFKPSVVLSLFGLHFFYLAPLLHLAWDYWPRWVIAPADWRSMLAWLSVLHVAGLLLYRLGLAVPHHRRTYRTVHVERLRTILGFFCCVSALSFIVLVAAEGGLTSYIRLITEDRENLGGYGWILLVAESWPLIGFIYLLIKFPSLRENALLLAATLLVVIVVQFFVGGLRGSRSNLIWPTLVALAYAHIFARRLPRRMMILGVIAVMPFMYLYGIYKGGGVDAVQAMRAGVSAEVLAGETGRGYDLVLLEDLGRAGTQVVVLDGITQDRGMGPAWGLGYVGDLTKLMPDFLMPIAVPDKVELGTAALYGTEVLEGTWRSSRIYGLTGEAMLNFGIPGAILVYAVLGQVVRRLDSLYELSLLPGDFSVGQFFSPLAVVGCVLLAGSDLDNVLWFTAKQGGLILLALALSAGPVRSVTQMRR